MGTRQWLSTVGASRRFLHSSLAQRRERCALVHTSVAPTAASTARDVSAFRVGVVGLGAIGTIFFTRLGRLAAARKTREGLPTLYVDALVKAEQFDTWIENKMEEEETVTMELMQDGQETETLDFQVLCTTDAAKVAMGCNVRVRALVGQSAGDAREDDDRLDVLMVTVKAHDSRDVMRALREKHWHLLQDDALCVLLQNGLGDEAVPAEAKENRLDDRWQLASGVTFVGGRVLAFAAVETSGLDVGKTYIAPFIGHVGETQWRKPGDANTVTMMQRDCHGTMQMLADVLVAAGLHCQVLDSDAMQATLWHKLIVNAAINPLASVLDAPNLSVASSESSRQCVRLVVQEALAVAQCEHVLLDRTHNELADDVFEVARNTGSNVCSMLADLRRESRTEIDAITGRIVAGGKRHGIPTPTNELLLLLIKALETERARRSR
ncbi:unnamed protein product [Hyaloperonospora brassicae]|uniref:2-dehydropantoate 2-reductase n=1 Tax=Hyaloperonospora brassicae TaxID=162125 RepID=A0AAV0TBF3_HYABA|nr:unnamed protein product [Hyaloperonospora brassicae]